MATPYHVKVAPLATRQIKEIAGKYRKQIFKAAESLAMNPRPADAKKIEGMAGLYSESVGDLRLIYKIEDQEVLILIVK